MIERGNVQTELSRFDPSSAEPNFEKVPTAGGIRDTSVTQITLEVDTVSMQIGNKFEAHRRHVTQTLPDAARKIVTLR